MQISAEDKRALIQEARVELARSGGQARMAKLTEEQKSELGRKAAAARWSRRSI